MAGPCGNLTRFPILPDWRGTRSNITILKEQIENDNVALRGGAVKLIRRPRPRIVISRTV